MSRPQPSPPVHGDGCGRTHASWLIRPLVILFALAALLTASSIAYTSLTTPDIHWREFAIAMIGTLLTVSGSYPSTGDAPLLHRHVARLDTPRSNASVTDT